MEALQLARECDKRSRRRKANVRECVTISMFFLLEIIYFYLFYKRAVIVSSPPLLVIYSLMSHLIYVTLYYFQYSLDKQLSRILK